MNLTDGDILRLMHGDPLFFKDICLVYSPTLGEIATAGLEKFYRYLSLMLIEKPPVENNDELGQVMKELSDFQYLCFLAQLDGEQSQLIKEGFEFFTHEQPTIITIPNLSIVVGDPSEKRVITEDMFEGFQFLIRASCALVDRDEEVIELLDTDSPKVRELKMKLTKGRKDRAKAKSKSKKDGDNKLGFSDLIASLLAGSNGAVNNQTVWSLTYYAFQDQLKRMNWREEFDINTRAAMAGAKIDKDKLSHWIKNMSFN